jgi:uncharacterized protein YaaQ
MCYLLGITATVLSVWKAWIQVGNRYSYLHGYCQEIQNLITPPPLQRKTMQSYGLYVLIVKVKDNAVVQVLKMNQFYKHKDT